MLYGKHVGRVGALAVALGVGVAVAGVPGVAWAQPADSGSTSATSESTDSSSASPSHDPASQAPAPAQSADGPRDDPSAGAAASPSAEPRADSAVSSADTETDLDSTDIEAADEPTADEQPATAAAQADTATGGRQPAQEPRPRGARAPAGAGGGDDLSRAHRADDARPRAHVGGRSEPSPSVDISAVPDRPATTGAQPRSAASAALADPPGAAVASATANSASASTSVPTAQSAQPVAVTSTLSNLVTALLAPVSGSWWPSSVLWAALSWTRREFESALLGGSALAAAQTNRAPVAVDDAATVAEDDRTRIHLLDNDSDDNTPNRQLSVTIAQPPTHGTAVVNPNGTVTYTSDGSEATSDSFRYTLTDTSGATSNAATVTITITPVNDAPVARDDTAAVAEGGTTRIRVLANDTDADGTLDPASIRITRQPNRGTVTVNTDGTVTYTSSGAERASDSFRYTVADNDGATSRAATVAISITPVNDAPVAGDDTATVAEGDSTTIRVLANDTDADGTIVRTSVRVTEQPSHGTVRVNANGTVTYISDGTETVGDSFGYTVADNSGATSNTATVGITVTPVNDAPVAVDDAASVTEGGHVAIALLGNDIDAEGVLDPTSVQIRTLPSHGTLTVNSAGGLTYSSDGTEVTSDAFTYTVADNAGAISNTATVTITVTPVNDAPIAVDDTATVAEGGSATIKVLANDTDADGTVIAASVAIAQQPKHGTITLNVNGSVTYSSDGTEANSDTFSYSVRDDSGATSNVAVVAITIAAVNDAPVALNDTATVVRGGSVTVAVRDNDTDADSPINGASVQIMAPPSHGTVTVNGDGTITYASGNNPAVTSDSFAYTLTDAAGATSNPATVTITVINPPLINALPVAADDSATVPEGGRVEIPVLANDTDADGTIDPASVQIMALPAHGSLVVSFTGLVTYVSDGTEAISDTFKYRVKDDYGAASNVATVTITITPVNDAPVAVNDRVATDEDTKVVVEPLRNDTDPEGHPLVIVDVTAPAHGEAVIGVDGSSIGYSPDPNFNGTDTFSYTVSDGFGGTASAAVTVTVNPVDDPVDLTGTVATGDAPIAVAVNADGSRLYVANAGDDTVTVIDTATNTVLATVAVGDLPRALAVNTATGLVYVVNQLGDSVSVIDPATNTVIDDINIALEGPVDAAFHPDFADLLYLTSTSTTAVSLIGTTAHTIETTFSTGSPSSAITFAYGTGYLLSADGHTVSVIVGFTDITATYHLDDYATDIAVAGPWLYAAGADTGTLTVFDLITGDPHPWTTIDVGHIPFGIAVGPNPTQPDLQLAYVTNYTDGTVSMIDPMFNAVIATIDVGNTPTGLVVSPDGSRVYVANTDDDTISVITVRARPNTNPIAVNDTVVTAQDTPIVIDPLANDTDLDLDSLLLDAITAGPTHGHAVIDETRTTITYTPDPGFHGTDTLTYTISDSSNGRASAAITVTVNPVLA